jgi:hypothetical protein
VSNEHLTFAAVVAAVAAGAVLGLLPSVADVRRAGPGDEVAHDLRSGLAIGGIVLVALGLLGTAATKSPMPLIIAGVLVTGIIAGFEWLLHTDGLRLEF